MRSTDIFLTVLLLTHRAACENVPSDKALLKRKLVDNNGQESNIATPDTSAGGDRDLMGLNFNDLTFWSVYSNNEVGSIPTASPVDGPTTPSPTRSPTKSPTKSPTESPTAAPVGGPTPPGATPPPSPLPTKSPTKSPTKAPTKTPTPPPTLAPVVGPSPPPTPPPTKTPTKSPTKFPTKAPTRAPTKNPTKAPTKSPTPAPTGSPFAETVILGAALGGAGDFSDPNSYQSCALARTLEQNGINGQREAKIIQYYSLFCIYCSTNAVPNVITNNDPRFDNLVTFPGWTAQNGWDQNNVDPCNFYGIICNFSDLVTQIDLSSNRLTGIFPPEIKLLAADGAFASGAGNLIALDLSSNEFVFNNFDTSWLSDTGTAMASIDFSVTSFAGLLPRFPTGLFEITINFSLYSGGLTNANFAGLNNLNYLEISGNSFGEPMPNILNQLNSLEQIFVEDSAITGGLDFMIGMPLIFQCWIDKNPAFGGTIPTQIGDLSTLASWSITENSFIGTIPTELGKLTNIQRLWMYGNDLVGNVPTEFGSLIQLELLRLEANDFTGTMPDEVCNLRNDFLSSLSLLGSVCGSGFSQCSCCDCCDIAECDTL